MSNAWSLTGSEREGIHRRATHVPPADSRSTDTDAPNEIEVEGDMEARRTTARRARGATALATAAAGALGGIGLVARRRAAGADEPLEAGALPEVEEAAATYALTAARGENEVATLRSPDAERGEDHPRETALARATP